MLIRMGRLNGIMKEYKSRRADGFTLLEVLVALTITGLMVSVLYTSFSQLTYHQQNLNSRMIALVFGESKLVEIEAGSELNSSGEFPEPYKNYHWNASEETALNGKMLTLTVEWRDIHTDVRRTVLTGYRKTE